MHGSDTDVQLLASTLANWCTFVSYHFIVFSGS